MNEGDRDRYNAQREDDARSLGPDDFRKEMDAEDSDESLRTQKKKKSAYMD